jgi:hypothetical protein
MARAMTVSLISPSRFLAAVMIGAALRSYAHALNAELVPQGIYAGTLVR